MDYYFSQKAYDQERKFPWMNEYSRESRINSMLFTEQIHEGRKPLSKWNDLKLVFSGVGVVTHSVMNQTTDS